MGATADLHVNLGWSKTDGNFGSVLDVLRREYQGGRMGTKRKDGPPAATATASSSDAIPDPDSGCREERVLAKKERKSRERG